MVKRVTVKKPVKKAAARKKKKVVAKPTKKVAKKTVIEPSGGLYFARPNKTTKFISTGAKVLDLIMGGGWARGRVGNVYGDTSTGKTLLMIEACRNFADTVPKGKIRYREAEEAFDESYARALGLPEGRVDFGNGDIDTVEDMFEDLMKVCDAAKGPELYIVDSLDSLAHRAELKRDLDAASYGGEKAKILSRMFRAIVRKLGEKDVTLLVVSQLRDTFAKFGKTKKPSGGKALPYYSSQRMALVQTGVLKKTKHGIEKPVGITVKAKIEKNKVGTPFREAEFSIRFGFGIDDAEACLRWLATTKYLNDVSLVKQNLPLYLRELDRMTREEYDIELRDLREAVERRYYEVEESFLPVRSKYA